MFNWQEKIVSGHLGFIVIDHSENRFRSILVLLSCGIKKRNFVDVMIYCENAIHSMLHFERNFYEFEVFS